MIADIYAFSRDGFRHDTFQNFLNGDFHGVFQFDRSTIPPYNLFKVSINLDDYDISCGPGVVYNHTVLHFRKKTINSRPAESGERRLEPYL
jgi:hypothetical protein